MTYLDDVFVQSQTKREVSKMLDIYLQFLLIKTLSAAQIKNKFFLTRGKIFGHTIEGK